MYTGYDINGQRVLKLLNELFETIHNESVLFQKTT